MKRRSIPINKFPKFWYKLCGLTWSDRLVRPRSGDQKGEQLVYDWWRENMGWNAPISNLDIVGYNNQKLVYLGEIKNGAEDWNDADRAIKEQLAQKADLPLYLLRFHESMVVVSVYCPDQKGKWDWEAPS